MKLPKRLIVNDEARDVKYLEGPEIDKGQQKSNLSSDKSEFKVGLRVLFSNSICVIEPIIYILKKIKFSM